MKIPIAHLAAAASCMPADPARPDVLRNVILERKDGRNVVIGTDGYILIAATSPGCDDGAAAKDGRFALLSDCLANLVLAATRWPNGPNSGFASVAMGLSGPIGYARVTTNRAEAGTTMVATGPASDGRLPVTDGVFPDTPPTASVLVDPRHLASILKALLVADPEMREVTLQLRGARDPVVLRAQNTGRGEDLAALVAPRAVTCPE